MKKTLLAFCAVLVLAVVASCKKEEPQAPAGPVGMPQHFTSYEKEAEILKSLLKDEPGNLNALVRLGNLNMDAKKYPEAIDAYSKALEVDPANVDVRVDMGTCYRYSGRSDRAVEEYRKALEQNPRHFNAHMNLAVVLAYDFGKRDEAIKEFEAALALDPASPNAGAIRAEIERLKAGG
jgi:tetratricopeptide (TPR) repeat protein